MSPAAGCGVPGVPLAPTGREFGNRRFSREKLIHWKQNPPHGRGWGEGISLLGGKKKRGWEHVQIVPKRHPDSGEHPFGDPFPAPGLEEKPAAFAAVPGAGRGSHTTLVAWGRPATPVAQPRCPSPSLAVFQVTPSPEPEISCFLLPGTLVKFLLLPFLSPQEDICQKNSVRLLPPRSLPRCWGV